MPSVPHVMAEGVQTVQMTAGGLADDVDVCEFFYGITRVVQDVYAGDWPHARLRWASSRNRLARLAVRRAKEILDEARTVAGNTQFDLCAARHDWKELDRVPAVDQPMWPEYRPAPRAPARPVGEFHPMGLVAERLFRVVRYVMNGQMGPAADEASRAASLAKRVREETAEWNELAETT